MNQIDILTKIALDLTSALDAKSRYRRLLEGLRRAIPYDAAALLRVEKDVLSVKAARGLSEDTMGRRFHLRDHPRLDLICHSRAPIIFPSDARIPDPFDGLLADQTLSTQKIHSCLGCPLYAGDRLIGALTADAVDRDAFARLDMHFLSAIGALAGAEMHTTDLMRALEISAEKMGLIAEDLMREVLLDKGKKMLGASKAMDRLRREIDLVARSDFSILITGETGVGKELVARAIHSASHRRDLPLLYVNCANLTESLAESELFGHTKGAYTGAAAERIGKFELADGGTLFLDEIGELPPSVQPKLLRVLQEGEVQKLGTAAIKQVDVRILAATNRNLENAVRNGHFRNDLYHRLNVYPLRVPPLRERVDDIPLLAGHFCESAQRRLGSGRFLLHRRAMEALKRYSWPGNVRELENIITRAVLKTSLGVGERREITILPENLDLNSDRTNEIETAALHCANFGKTDGMTLKQAVDQFTREYILGTVESKRGNWAAAARRLGIHRSNLHKLARRLNVE
ncbi:MAG: nitric oxide reductase transcriptional regulator NorR [Deltaproteobacteria bacterium]|nr:nitric oxide reductase transcriptional regulator NorR [Deltaproteobacteria bacterium]